MALFVAALTVDEVEQQWDKLKELRDEGFINTEEYAKRVVQLKEELEPYTQHKQKKKVSTQTYDISARKRKREEEPVVEVRKPSPPRRSASSAPSQLTKFWAGFPVTNKVRELEDAIQKIGGHCRDPHFTLGWCQFDEELKDLFLSAHFERSLLSLKSICQSMQMGGPLYPTKFEILGKLKDKVAVIYEMRTANRSPYLAMDLHNQDLLDIWRRVAKDYSRKTRTKFSSVSGALEKGFIDGKLAYQIRAIPLKLHLTIGEIDNVNEDLRKLLKGGRATKSAEELLADFPRLEVQSSSVYISCGRTRHDLF